MCGLNGTMDTTSFIRSLPKAELHLHIEGTLEPEMMFDLAAAQRRRSAVRDVDEVRAAYEFTDLQSFLDIYYQGAAVLLTEQDFYDLMWAYLERCRREPAACRDLLRPADPHRARHRVRGVHGRLRPGAMARRRAAFGISTALIMCFLRHLTGEAAIATWNAGRDRSPIGSLAVGLDSGRGRAIRRSDSPQAFAPGARRRPAHRRPRRRGGPPAYISGALDVLGAERIDHGVRLRSRTRPWSSVSWPSRSRLTMCPLSNVKLRVFDTLADHNLKRLLDRGIRVTVNSDDPAYFGGYLTDNYLARPAGPRPEPRRPGRSGPQRDRGHVPRGRGQGSPPRRTRRRDGEPRTAISRSKTVPNAAALRCRAGSASVGPVADPTEPAGGDERRGQDHQRNGVIGRT